MSGDPYIKENEELRAEIERLRIENSHRISQCHDLNEMLEDKEAEIARLREQQSILDHNHDHYAREIKKLRAALEEIQLCINPLLSDGWSDAQHVTNVIASALAK